jgi:hypothetical protein
VWLERIPEEDQQVVPASGNQRSDLLVAAEPPAFEGDHRLPQRSAAGDRWWQSQIRLWPVSGPVQAAHSSMSGFWRGR